jgi:SAM-dependent methyltransferase
METQTALEQFEAQHGRFSFEDYHIKDGVYTRGGTSESRPYFAESLRKYKQVITDFAGKPLSELRILDVGSLEGLYGVELAHAGARVVAVDARADNLKRIAFVKQQCGLDNLELLNLDLRKLHPKVHGSFDVVLLLGILYHLDYPTLIDFLIRIRSMTRLFVLIDTHVSLFPRIKLRYRGREYAGAAYPEHRPDDSEHTKIKVRIGASVGNDDSFWFTEASLYNFLADYGYTSVLKIFAPSTPDQHLDRISLLARPGTPVDLTVMPDFNGTPSRHWPEDRPAKLIDQVNMLPNRGW